MIGETRFLVGHRNGQLVEWDLGTKKRRFIADLGSEIESISVSVKEEIAVGCHSGLLVILDPRNPEVQEIIQEATSSVFSRVWRVAWVDDRSLISTSTYGSITFWIRNAPKSWSQTKIEGHRHSVFGLGVSNNLCVSGDYNGDIMVSTIDGQTISPRTNLSTSRVQNLALGRDGSFASISRIGSLRFFEYDLLNKDWDSPIDVATTTSEGNCVHITDDGKSVFAGTETELIQFDVQSQLIQRASTIPIVGIFSTQKSVFALTVNGIIQYERSDAEVPLALVKYKYAKISLVGHTEAGKTSFCKNLLGEDIQGTKSTEGRIIQTWVPNTDSSSERRIALYDHGGQRTVLGTFIPFVMDSDVILVFFSQRDLNSWERVEDIVRELKEAVARGSKVLLVRTHIDEANEVRELPVKRLLEAYPNIQGPYLVNNMNRQGIEELKQALLAAIDWDRVRTVIQSKTNQAVESVVEDLKRERADVVGLAQIRKKVEQRTNSEVPLGHLMYLLQTLTLEGSIEFYPKISDSVIFNDDSYNKLKSDIPFYVAEHGGVVTIDELLENHSPPIYVKMLDAIHTQYGLSVKDNGVRLYPTVFPNRTLVPPPTYQDLLKNPFSKRELRTPPQTVGIVPFLAALFDMKLQCIMATRESGLFAWEKNACVLFTARVAYDPQKGEYGTFDFAVAGTKTHMCDRLDRELTALVRQLYGELPPDESA